VTSFFIRERDRSADEVSRPPARAPGVLIADDMGLILTLLKFALERDGFTVWLAVDGDDAVDLYRRNRSGIDLVLLDVQMPGMDGPRTLEALRRINPDVLACFMTGNGGPYTRDELLARGAARVFAKPFVAHTLARALCEVLSAAGLGTAPAPVEEKDGCAY
jgi:CheY-like chemotaxis protein